LTTSFYPIVKETMGEIGAIKTYDDYVGKFSSNPLMKMTDIDMDISRYVTEKTVDGLFVMVAEQEKKIRENPAARVTDVLKSVFGK
jgi:DNA-directed RNA polymerase delta subunit